MKKRESNPIEIALKGRSTIVALDDIVVISTNLTLILHEDEKRKNQKTSDTPHRIKGNAQTVAQQRKLH